MKRVTAIAFAAALPAFAAIACSSETPAPAPDPLALALPVDLNGDPNVLEIDLEAKPATKQYGAAPITPVWTFGGTVPGPLLDAKVGDKLIVRLKNSLPEPTSIHWHGLRLPAAMDGTPAMQSPIKPGETFRYEFILKDAGLFWYHPHVRSDIQIQKGLYGAMRVRGADEPEVDDERILVLDDVRLKEDGTLAEYLDDEAKMMGREGNTLLVNGSPDATLPVRAGEALRLRLVNVANGRFFNLRLPGHTWRVIGTDGGRIEKPYDTERILMAPGERYDVMVIPNGAPGSELELINEPYARGHDSEHAKPMTMARVRFSNDAPLTGRVLPDRGPVTAPFPAATQTVPVALNEGTRDGELVFTINDAVYPAVPPIKIERGGLRVLEVKNESEMDHPFHLHGFFFQVLEKNGVAVPLDTMGNKDTLILTPHSTQKLLAQFDEPGKWMYHCHILEHGEAGMMGEVHVE